jgi:hypothetical protein
MQECPTKPTAARAVATLGAPRTAGAAATAATVGATATAAMVGAPVAAARTMDGGVPGEPDAKAPGCDLNGTYVLGAEADVDWEGTSLAGFIPVLAPGSGELHLVILLRIEDKGDGRLEAVARACDVRVPDFASTTVGEKYAVIFPEQSWDAPSSPTWSLKLTSECNEPGCALESEQLDALVGADMDNPAGPWPSKRNARGLRFPDHDDDGYPGFTLLTLGPDDTDAAGEAYARPPVDVLTVERATKIMLGIRFRTRFVGVMDSCDTFTGDGPGTRIDTRAITCMRQNQLGVERECDVPSAGALGSQRDFVDGNLPAWRVLQTRWRGARIADDAGCAEARARLAELKH